MARRRHMNLSRRERQIMDILYRRGPSSAKQVLNEMPDPPSYSAVRAMLRILEEKGFLKHEQDGQRYIYLPALPRGKARRTALRHLVDTFFDGSAEKAGAALLDVRANKLCDEELDRLAKLVEKAREEGR